MLDGVWVRRGSAVVAEGLALASALPVAANESVTAPEVLVRAAASACVNDRVD